MKTTNAVIKPKTQKYNKAVLEKDVVQQVGKPLATAKALGHVQQRVPLH